MNAKNFGNEQVAMYTERFNSQSIQELIDLFNVQVGLNAWTSQRAYYIEALVSAMQNKGISIDAIKTEQGISLKKKVTMCGSKLVTE